MKVFVLSTGRAGSTTFERACRHITNYSAGHESARDDVGAVIPPDVANFADNHIESDNRLAWFLGRIDEHYGDQAFYVHLIRNKAAVVASFTKKWEYETSIIKAYGEGVLMYGPNLPEDSTEICGDYWETVNANIRGFLKNRSHTLRLDLDDPKDAFREFWQRIGAQGDLEAALREWDVKHNATDAQWQPAPLLKQIERHLRRTPGLDRLKRRLMPWRAKYK